MASSLSFIAQLHFLDHWRGLMPILARNALIHDLSIPFDSCLTLAIEPWL